MSEEGELLTIIKIDCINYMIFSIVDLITSLTKKKYRGKTQRNSEDISSFVL
jgi:hypothetical protein